MYLGKAIFGTLGFMFGHLGGAVLGLLLGHLVDEVLTAQQSYHSGHALPLEQDLFKKSLLLLMGYVAKSDGHISKAEINKARYIMARLPIKGSELELAMKLFYQGKRGEFEFEETIGAVRAVYHNQNHLRLFMDLLLELAYSDGIPNTKKQYALQSVAQSLGLGRINFSQINAFYGYHSNYQQHYKHQDNYRSSQKNSHHNSTQSLGDAYAILGINSSATNAEAKKAYQKLLSQYHPDKLIAKKLPEDMIKLANEKTAKIKAAYEQIKLARGLS